MKKKVLFSIFILSLLVAFFLYYHPTHYKFNDRFIIGNNAEIITEKYGPFLKINYNSAGKIIYGAYLIKENTPDLIMSIDDSLWYEVYFENEIAVKVKLQKGWYGG